MEKIELLSLNKTALSAISKELCEPDFRAVQLFDWLHRRRITDIETATNLSKKFRAKLSENYSLCYPVVSAHQSDTQGTTKYLLRYCDGVAVEAVLMHHNHGDSLCISTQAGCRMGCKFCASTGIPFIRNLTVGELLSQVYTVANITKNPPHHIVLMGIGEPLDNLENVMCFLSLLTCSDGYNISGRNISLSTCGLVPMIDRLAGYKIPLTLSVSLHRTTSSARAQVMPIEHRYSLESVVAAAFRYKEQSGRRISFEYAVVEGENDTDGDVLRLAEMLKGGCAHVNVIPLNDISGSGKQNSFAAQRFSEKLEKAGVRATVRRSLGAEIDAACGQLRARQQQ